MVDAPEKIWAASVTENYGEWQTTTDGLPRPTEYTRSDLVAELAAENERLAGARVKVKPLEWEDADEGMCTKWRAAALGGHYELVALDGDDGGLAVNFHWGRPLSFWFIQGEPDERGPTGPKMFPTLEDAKSAAQADYERRILSALAEPAGEVEPCQFLPTEDGEFNGNTFGNGDDVPFGWITQRAYDHAYTTSDPVQVTILRTESGPGLMPRVPLYTTPPDASAIREAEKIDPVELVRQEIQKLSKEKDAAEYVIATMVTNLKTGKVTTDQLLEWFDGEGRAALAGRT